MYLVIIVAIPTGIGMGRARVFSLGISPGGWKPGREIMLQNLRMATTTEPAGLLEIIIVGMIGTPPGINQYPLVSIDK